MTAFDPAPGIENVIYVPGALLWWARASDADRTSLAKPGSKKLLQEITVRNANTTRKLHALMQQMAEGGDT